MKINGKEISVEDLVIEMKNIDELKKRENGLILRDSHIEVLNRYNIDYRNHSSLKSLIFEIEEVLEEEDEAEDLEKVSEELSEINYYNYTNK